MKAKELSKKLKMFDPDTEIVIRHPSHGCANSIGKVREEVFETKTVTSRGMRETAVVIEAEDRIERLRWENLL